MLRATRLSFAHPITSENLIESEGLAVVAGETVALVGPNGCGKSSLLELLCGLRTPDVGEVVLERGATWAYLCQDTKTNLDISVGQCAELRVRTDSIWAREEEADWHQLCRRFRVDGDVLELGSTCASLGQIQRTSLARALACRADVLLLDEPTNNMDRESIELLESLLQRERRAVLMVCHDRALVDACADRLLSIEHNGLRNYPGGYTDYLAQKKRELAAQLDSYERAHKENKRLKKAAEEKARKAAKITKRKPGNNYSKGAKPHFGLVEKRMQKKAKAVMKRAERAIKEAADKPFVDDGANLVFPVPLARSGAYVSVSQISKSYACTLFKNLSLHLSSGSRVAVVGPNGAGKSTLMKIVLGELSPDSGQVDTAPGIKFATLTQARGALDPDEMAIDALEGEETMARTLLGRLGVRKETPKQSIKTLSVGERTKVEIVSLLITPAHVLVLDEPTNHLDIEAMEALENALIQFAGAVLFAAHDRRFVENVATEVIELGR